MPVIKTLSLAPSEDDDIHAGGDVRAAWSVCDEDGEVMFLIHDYRRDAKDEPGDIAGLMRAMGIWL